MKTMQPLERASPGIHGCWQKPWLVCNRLSLWAGHTQLHWWCAEFPADRWWGQRADALCSWCQAARLPLCASQYWLPALSWGHPRLIFVNVQHLAYTAKTPRTEEVEVRDTHRDPSELSTLRLSGLNVFSLFQGEEQSADCSPLSPWFWHRFRLLTTQMSCPLLRGPSSPCFLWPSRCVGCFCCYQRYYCE